MFPRAREQLRGLSEKEPTAAAGITQKSSPPVNQAGQGRGAGAGTERRENKSMEGLRSPAQGRRTLQSVRLNLC